MGFLLDIYRRKTEIDQIYLLFLLLLLQILYNNGFEPVQIPSLEPLNIEEFSKFSLQVSEPRNSRQSKLFLGEFVEKPQIPLPFLIIEDPLVVIKTEILWKNLINYKFESLANLIYFDFQLF